jgi:hypothetical protein
MANKNWEVINVKLYEGIDDELIEYMKGKPKTWLVKEALKTYKKLQEQGHQVHQHQQQQAEKEITAASEGLMGL